MRTRLAFAALATLVATTVSLATPIPTSAQVTAGTGTAVAKPIFGEPKMELATERKSGPNPRASARLAACPGPGKRVITEYAVYLVDPDWYLNWIPSLTVYNNLWDNWNGLIQMSEKALSECFDKFWPMENAHLAMAPNGATHIYDATIGGYYRHIINPTVFGNYGFSWAKVRGPAALTAPIGPAWWR